MGSSTLRFQQISKLLFPRIDMYVSANEFVKFIDSATNMVLLTRYEVGFSAMVLNWNVRDPILYPENLWRENLEKKLFRLLSKAHVLKTNTVQYVVDGNSPFIKALCEYRVMLPVRQAFWEPDTENGMFEGDVP